MDPPLAPEIVTGRLRLERLTAADSEAILSGRRDAAWSAGYPTAGDRAVARWLSSPRFVPRDPRFGPRRIVVREGGVVIGGVGFHGVARHGEVEIGFGIAPEWRGRGIGAEAVTAFVRYAFSLPGVERVRAVTEADNEASARTLERAGLVLEGRDGPRRRFAAVRDAGPLSGDGGPGGRGGAGPGGRGRATGGRGTRALPPAGWPDRG